MPYPTQPTASHFINGTYVEDTAGAEIPVIYPATGEQIAVVHEATPAIVEQAITSAKAAQQTTHFTIELHDASFDAAPINAPPKPRKKPKKPEADQGSLF